MKITIRILFGLSFVSGSVLAQSAPDAGQLLQEQLLRTPQPPRTASPPDIRLPSSSPTAEGGAKVELKSIRITGNTRFDEATLVDVVGDVRGKSLDLAGLRELADLIRVHYNRAGYPFARAFLPSQQIKDGVLYIKVVEGRYGKIQPLGEESLSDCAKCFVATLAPGSLIENSQLERTVLILDDLPGLKVEPVIRPGDEFGTGNLDVHVLPTEQFLAEVGVDNHGNRYTGTNRIRANLQWDSPFMVGDQAILRGIYTEEEMWMGSLNYSVPLGCSGLRGNIGLSHTYYQLAKDFANLEATGTADVVSAGLSYPIIRSQQTNLALTATLQKKQLNDRQNLLGTNDLKSSESIPVSLNFDQRDNFGWAGITYGALTYTSGNLHLDGTLEAQDRASGRNKRGQFDKWNLDVARFQTTGVNNLSIYARISAQWAGKNLDSSEGFTLGGPNGVRAYPVGEAAGDEGYLGQFELRYAVGDWVPFVFYDAGKVHFNAATGSLTTPVAHNSRTLGGGGIGLRYQQGALNVDASLAWRKVGGSPQSDTVDHVPVLWLSANYHF